MHEIHNYKTMMYICICDVMYIYIYIYIYIYTGCTADWYRFLGSNFMDLLKFSMLVDINHFFTAQR